MESPNRKPVAVLISDIHYNLNNLELADKATRMAVAKANRHNVPLIVAGDLHDTKASLRGECIKAILDTLGACRTPSIVIVANHDRINEKSTAHSLEFLRNTTVLIDKPRVVNISCVNGKYLQLIPYYHDPDELRDYLKRVDPGTRIIMHQGIEGSNMGDYVQDKSAIRPEDVANFRVISGHYHGRQTINTGPLRPGYVGQFDYIGSPFTHTYGEANDPPKGFQVLHSDGSLEFIPTNLRKHVVINCTTNDLKVAGTISVNPDDLLWFKITDTRENLVLVTRHMVEKAYSLNGMSFRLDLIPTDTKTETPAYISINTQSEILDGMIESVTGSSDDQKLRLKILWKSL